MADLLIELFSEEIPARMQARAGEDLKKRMTDGLVEAGLTYAGAHALTTPRRLTLTLEGMLDASPAITEERKENIDFTKPYLRNVAEVIVGRSNLPEIDKLESLSGKAVFINPKSSFAEHLAEINKGFDWRGLSLIKLIPANTKLTDEDILQMVNSGIVDFTIADLHVAENWAQILPNLRVYDKIKINDKGKLAWAIRQDSPLLMAAINKSMKSVKKGSLLGNIYFKKYFIFIIIIIKCKIAFIFSNSFL